MIRWRNKGAEAQYRNCFRWNDSALAVALTVTAGACATAEGLPEPRQYPARKLEVSALTLEVSDRRDTEGSEQAFREPSELYSGARAKQPVRLPADFQPAAQTRLDRLVGGGGESITVTVEIQQLDVTWQSFPQGNEVRVDGAVRVVVRSPEGHTLQKGTGTAHHELPEAQITEAEIRRAVSFVVLDAFDRYWTDEGTLSRLNQNLKAYSSRPR